MIENKKIWTYWHQGFDAAPKIVKYCADQWQIMHPNWEVILLDKCSIEKYVTIEKLPKEKWLQLGIAHRSDILRTELLIKYGGVWADPTTFCTAHLETWLPEKMDSGFFFFSNPGRDRIISNWFIASEKNNQVLRKLLDRLYSYWISKNLSHVSSDKKKWIANLERLINRKPFMTRFWLTQVGKRLIPSVPYFVYHYYWNQLVSTDEESRKSWQIMPKVSAVPLHRLQRFGLLNPVNTEVKIWFDNYQLPMQKLNWKKVNNKDWKGSNLEYFLNNFCL